jgi:tetratricopeptide (TPR) repeat protein
MVFSRRGTSTKVRPFATRFATIAILGPLLFAGGCGHWDRTQQAMQAAQRGQSYNRQGNFEEAIGAYTEAIQLKPDFVLAYQNRGRAYNDKGDFHKAISDFTEAIRLNPNFGEAYYWRGLSYKEAGVLDKAERDLARAKQLGGEA